MVIYSGGGSKAAVEPALVPNELVRRMLDQLPPGLREQAAQIAPCLLPHGPSIPGYFDVLANSINIKQDYIPAPVSRVSRRR